MSAHREWADTQVGPYINIMKRTGFTFIELIVTITIFTVIIITVYSTFNMGLKTWSRGRRGEPLQKLRVALLKIEKELKDTFFFSKRGFRGTPEEMEFPLVAPDGDTKKLNIVTYIVNLDEETGQSSLVRKEKVYTEEEGDAEEKTKTILSLSHSIKFKYAHQSIDPTKSFEWQEDWDKDMLPSGVRVSLEMDEGGGNYSKVIFLQQGEPGIK